MTNSPVRIALFFHDLAGGGAERVMLQLAQGFLEAGHSVDLVLARAEGPLLSEVPANARVVGFNTRKPFGMFVKLIQYLREVRPAVLLSPFEVTSVIAIVAKKMIRARTRIVVRISVHLSQNKRTKFKKIIERFVVARVYPLADEIVTVSQGVADDLSAYAGLARERISVIYNPVVVEQLLQAAERPVSHPFFDGQYPVILGVGRLTEQKDFPTLIKAFAVVRKKIPARLLILGEGEDRAALEKMILSLGLQGWVDLSGFALNPFAFMKRSDVFVLSSKWEGLPNVLIQAMACGCPVISTDCPSGPSEILHGGAYGLLVPVGDVDAMAVALETVLTGGAKKPSASWLEQYTAAVVIPQYLSALGV